MRNDESCISNRNLLIKLHLQLSKMPLPTAWFIVRWRGRKWQIHCRVLHQLRRHLLDSMSKGNRCNLLQALSRAQLVLSLRAQWVIWTRAHCFLNHAGHLHNKMFRTWSRVEAVEHLRVFEELRSEAGGPPREIAIKITEISCFPDEGAMAAPRPSRPHGSSKHLVCGRFFFCWIEWMNPLLNFFFFFIAATVEAAELVWSRSSLTPRRSAHLLANQALESAERSGASRRDRKSRV